MATSPDLAELYDLRVKYETLALAKRADGPVWRSAWRQRERWTPRWQRTYEGLFEKNIERVDLDELVVVGQKSWSRVEKAQRPSFFQVVKKLRQWISPTEFLKGALAVYVGLALDESEDAGQYTLDALGLNKTFAWASVRDFPANPFSVHGSKVLQHAYGEHLERLAKMVLDKTNPAQPQTIEQLKKNIRNEWPEIGRKHASLIARTEAANVWEITNFNAMMANGVARADWLVAVGPNIGIKSEPVCEDCLRMAADNPWVIDDLEIVPPYHPQCRCTLVPSLDPEWLPPDEPWAGAKIQLRTFE